MALSLYRSEEQVKHLLCVGRGGGPALTASRSGGMGMFCTHNRKEKSEISKRNQFPIARKREKWQKQSSDALTEHLARLDNGAKCLSAVCCHKGSGSWWGAAQSCSCTSGASSAAKDTGGKYTERLWPSSSFVYLQITPRMCAASGL